MPLPLTVTGKSRVFPLLVMLPVLAKVTVFPPALTVMPVDAINEVNDMSTFVHEPEKPVKSNAPTALFIMNETVSVPAVMSISGPVAVTLNVRVPVEPE